MHKGDAAAKPQRLWKDLHEEIRAADSTALPILKKIAFQCFHLYFMVYSRCFDSIVNYWVNSSEIQFIIIIIIIITNVVHVVLFCGAQGDPRLLGSAGMNYLCGVRGKHPNDTTPQNTVSITGLTEEHIYF